MQKYTNYIIGLLIVLIVGVLVYSLSGTSVKPKDSMEQEIAVHSNDVYGEATTTNTQATTTANTEKTTTKKMSSTYMINMQTSKGNIKLELNTNIAPKTVENFLKLANSGFYDGVKFHRVIKDFMIQAGDPQSKDDKLVNAWGTGGPGYKFEDEITDPATYQNGYKRGILAMANSGPNTNGSQFFIMHKDMALPPNYTIFGKVVEGIETVDAIANSATGPADRPIEAIVIKSVRVE
jgi:cyclophilin family peptidyl-prolyl cis-trans isomerase